MLVLKILKGTFGIFSFILSVVLLVYLGLKNENWAIVTSNNQLVINKTMGICLIVVWAVVGILFLLFEFLYKRQVKNKKK